MDGGAYIRDMKHLLKDMLSYAYSLEGDEKEAFIKEVDSTILELQEFAEGLIPEQKEKDDE